MKCLAMSRKRKLSRSFYVFWWGEGRERKETCLNIISHLLPFKDFSTTFLKILPEKTEFATHWQFSDCFFGQGSRCESHNCISVESVLHFTLCGLQMLLSTEEKSSNYCCE